MLNPVFVTDAEIGHYGDDNTVEAQIALFTHGVNRTLIAPTKALTQIFTTEEQWWETYFQIGDLYRQEDYLFENLKDFKKELTPEQYKAFKDLIAAGLASLERAHDEHLTKFVWGE